MSELVSLLEPRGYVKRRVDPSDRRARIVSLTGSGRRLARQALRELVSIEAEWHGYLAGPGAWGDIVGRMSKALDRRASFTAVKAPEGVG